MRDTIKNCKLNRNAMDITNEVSKPVNFSPKRNAIFDQLKEELSPDIPGFRVLCLTRWTVRTKSLRGMQNTLHHQKKFLGQETLQERQVSVCVSMQESASFEH